MNARQLALMTVEHGPVARGEIVAELDTLARRQEELRSQLQWLDDMLIPAKKMAPNPGTMEPTP